MEGRGERRTKGGKVIKDGCEGSGGEWTERIAYDQRNTLKEKRSKDCTSGVSGTGF
jgi:hypothetical protein